MDRLYLGQMTVDIKTEQSVPTSNFINVNVDAVAKVPHIALEGVLEVPGDLLRALVQKVLGRQLDALRVGGDADLCHGITPA